MYRAQRCHPGGRRWLSGFLLCALVTGAAAAQSITPTRIWSQADSPGQSLGYGIATGDINGDGFQDVLIGAPLPVNSDSRRLGVPLGVAGTLL